MANPNYSELILHAEYGPDEDGRQTCEIYEAISDDSDEIDHKFVYAVPIGGLYIELAHYTSVKQVILQNMSVAAPPVFFFNGATFYVDNTTGALIPDFVQAGEHISFNDPDVTTGIMLYSIAALEETDWEIIICGRKD